MKNTWRQWLSKALCVARTRKAQRSRRLLELEVLESRDVPTGTWTPLANLAPTVAGNFGRFTGTPYLLTDGTVMMQGGDVVNTWYKLTPDSGGSYINGTWSQLASMSTQR